MKYLLYQVGDSSDLIIVHVNAKESFEQSLGLFGVKCKLIFSCESQLETEVKQIQVHKPIIGDMFNILPSIN